MLRIFAIFTLPTIPEKESGQALKERAAVEKVKLLSNILNKNQIYKKNGISYLVVENERACPAEVNTEAGG